MLRVTCIPAYDEEQFIEQVVKRCLKFSDKVIVCDDGSTDDTAKKAENAGAIVIKHDINKGKGAALKSLFRISLEMHADVIITIDGDGQFLPEEIDQLTRPIIDGRSDIVIGYRFDDTSQMPNYRKVGNKVLDRITNLASNLPFRDTQSGFRAYSKKAIELIHFVNDGFSADSEILIDASKKNLKIVEEKVTVIYDTGGKTSTKNPISHSAGIVASLVEIIAIKYPLKTLGIPGFILIVIGTFFSILVISYFNETRQFSIPSTLIALGGLIIGTLLLLMSIVLFSISKATRRWRNS